MEHCEQARSCLTSRVSELSVGRDSLSLGHVTWNHYGVLGAGFCDEKRSFCDDAFWYKYDHLLEETGERSSKLDAVNSTPGLRKLLLRL